MTCTCWLSRRLARAWSNNGIIHNKKITITMNKITIIGSGNIGLSLAKGLVNKAYCQAEDITLTRRNLKSLSEEAAKGFRVSDNNKVAIYDAHVIVLAVLPQQLKKVLEEIAPAVAPEKQLVISVVSGVSCADVR